MLPESARLTQEASIFMLVYVSVAKQDPGICLQCCIGLHAMHMSAGTA